jgi:type I restriction enzyme S subunit
MSHTLESIARVIFRSWFVDFDAVRAKAEGCDSGLPPALADLLPDRLVQCEFGEIPEGWSTVPLYGVAEFINGATYGAFEPNADGRGLPIVKIAELKSGVTSQTRFSEVQMPEKYRISQREILFSWSGNPDTSIDTFVWAHDEAWLNQHIFRVLPQWPHERSFVLTLLRRLRPVFAEIARDKQTTGLGHVTAADMKRLLVVRPDDRVLRAWDEVAGPLLEQAFVRERENGFLADLRDALLPRLLSGELRVASVDDAKTLLEVL